MVQILSILSCLVVLLVVPQTTHAHKYATGNLVIVKPHIRETPPAATVAAGYVSITNKGNQPETLISATSDISEKTEIHEMTIQDEVMKMRKIVGGIVIKPNETIRLEPIGYHLMFIELSTRPNEGDSHNITLKFEIAGEITVPFKVWEMNSSNHKNPQGHKHH